MTGSARQLPVLNIRIFLITGRQACCNIPQSFLQTCKEATTPLMDSEHVDQLNFLQISLKNRDLEEVRLPCRTRKEKHQTRAGPSCHRTPLFMHASSWKASFPVSCTDAMPSRLQPKIPMHLKRKNGRSFIPCIVSLNSLILSMRMSSRAPSERPAETMAAPGNSFPAAMRMPGE